jgi:threonine aldolase
MARPFLRSKPDKDSARSGASGRLGSKVNSTTYDQGRRMNFASDNTAGIAPDILAALAAGNDGFVLGYGNDDLTRTVEKRIGELFERDAAVFLLPTGTAANALALAHVSPPWGAVFAHTEAHILTDECGAPEFFGGGLKLVGMPGVGCKVSPETLAATVSQYQGHAPHQVVPAAFSFAQASEAGTIYRPGEVAALAKIAHGNGMTVHMDGARFGNALVRMNASPAEATWKAGVDVLSFGATKGGALAAEAVVFFDRAAAEHMGERRKRAGHLLSKHRFLALQFQAYLADDCWLRLARHANAMADRLATGLASVGRAPVWPVEANLVFVLLPAALEARLRAAGARYYVRRSDSLPDGKRIGADQALIRLVTSFATREDEVDRFVDLAAKG